MLGPHCMNAIHMYEQHKNLLIKICQGRIARLASSARGKQFEASSYCESFIQWKLDVLYIQLLVGDSLVNFFRCYFECYDMNDCT
jgi:hypothetical protein